MKLIDSTIDLSKLKSTDKVECECYECKRGFYRIKKEVVKEIKNPLGNVKFCSRSCANSSNNRRRVLSSETKDKIRRAINNKNKILFYFYDCEKCGNEFKSKIKIRKERLKTCNQCRGSKIVKDISKIQSILELSLRTVQKILKKLNVGCSICGWDKTSIDIHHIEGRKIKNPDDHTNLICLCPNCHRLAHEKKIEKNLLFENSLKNKPIDWKSYYNIKIPS